MSIKRSNRQQSTVNSSKVNKPKFKLLSTEQVAEILIEYGLYKDKDSATTRLWQMNFKRRKSDLKAHLKTTYGLRYRPEDVNQWLASMGFF